MTVDAAASTLEPLIRDLTPQLEGIVTALLPALVHVGGIGIKLPMPFLAQFRCAKGDAARKPIAHCPFAHPQPSPDFSMSESGLAQLNHLAIAISPFGLVCQMRAAR